MHGCGTRGSSPKAGDPLSFGAFITGATKKLNIVVGANVLCNYRVDFWNYAKAGNPKRVVRAKIAPYFPAGEAVSPPAGK